MERTSRSSYLPIKLKIIALGDTIAISDTLRFLMQSAFELKLISLDRYANIFPRLELIGQMLGGWKKGMEKKVKLESKIDNKTENKLPTH